MTWALPGRLSYRFVALFAILSSLSLFFFYSPPSYRSLSSVRFGATSAHDNSELSKVLVVAATVATLGNATKWTSELTDWPVQIWVADDLNAPFHTERNKGNEANHYLTYIINNYHALSDVTVFTHHHDRSLQVDKALWTNSNTLRHLNLTHVIHNGYQSLRCERAEYCVLLNREFWNQAKEDRYKDAWVFALAPEPYPDIVIGPCCAQFAVSKQTVLNRPKETYQKLHQWLMQTTYDDGESGRVFEYLWHILFGKPALYCPDQDRCFCNAFGLCEPGPNLGWNPNISDPIFEHWPLNETSTED